MRTFKQFLFILVVVAGLSLGVSAQKGGQQRPPKDTGKIEPKDKQKPPPKGDERPKKKPGYSVVILKHEEQNSAD